MNSTAYLQSKPRYDILDGLRGVAAMVIVLYHLAECHFTSHVDALFNHGYLGVEFFLVLSGFVIGYAYDDRWGKMSTWGFFKRRLVRMHPMVIWAAVLGMLMFYFGGCPTSFNVDSTPWYLLLLNVLMTMLLIPLPRSATSLDIRGWGELNAVNGPVWTLMYEYICNILYAFFIRKFPKWLLWVCAVMAAVCIGDLAFNLNLFGIIGDRGYEYSTIGGFYFAPDHIYVGFVRTLGPFLLGYLLSRTGRKISVKGVFWVTAIGLFVLLVIPYIGSDSFRIMDGAYDFLCIVVIFPLLVAVGSGSTIKGRKTEKFCKFLGDISYPIYLTNYPFAYMERAWVENHPEAPLSTKIFVFVSCFIMITGLAYAVYHMYDLPVREWLKDHWLHRKNSQK